MTAFRYDFAAVRIAMYRNVFIKKEIAAFYTLFDTYPLMRRRMSDAELRDWFHTHNMGCEPYRHAD